MTRGRAPVGDPTPSPGTAYLETTTWNVETPKVVAEWQEDGTARVIAHNEEKHTYVELNLGKASAKKLAATLANPPAAAGPKKDTAYLETTIPDLVAQKVTFDWQPDGSGRLIVHNEDKHTYVEVALKPETVQALLAAMGQKGKR